MNEQKRKRMLRIACLLLAGVFVMDKTTDVRLFWAILPLCRAP